MHACVISHFGCIQLFVTLWTVAGQAPLTWLHCISYYTGQDGHTAYMIDRNVNWNNHCEEKYGGSLKN